MAQRILEPGEIETLAERSIPRIRLPDRAFVFARRAARLRKLASGAALGDYLQFLALLVEAQHALLAQLSEAPSAAAHVARSAEHGMPPIHASLWLQTPAWRATLEALCTRLAARPDFPAGVAAGIAMIRGARSDWIENQAASIFDARHDALETQIAPLIMAALQVHAVALATNFVAAQVKPLDIPGVCPLCGTTPVASIVCAQSPYQGYRYLHCALCATEWHMVRVKCSHCGASGKDIGYHCLVSLTAEQDPGAKDAAAVRAETCDQCRGYRKILYQEKDPGVEPVADDVASLALDLLLGEEDYHRVSSNPLLWLPDTNRAS
jgi:FdhE protein